MSIAPSPPVVTVVLELPTEVPQLIQRVTSIKDNLALPANAPLYPGLLPATATATAN